LLDAEALRQIDLEAADFFSEQNQLVFGAMLKLGDAANEITVCSYLNDIGKLDDIGGPAYTAHLVAICPTSLHIVHYASVVKKYSFARRLISAAGQVENIGYMGLEPKEAFTKSQEIINNTGKRLRVSQVLRPAEICEMATTRYETMRRVRPGILYGIGKIDEYLLGVLPHEFAVLGAPGGTGKTTLAMQCARRQAREKVVYFFTTEMDRHQITDKNVAYIAGMDIKDLIRGNYSDTVFERINQAIWKLAELKLYIIDGVQTTQSIRQTVERALDTTGCDIVYIDYLQNLADSIGKNSSDEARIHSIAMNLQYLAKECTPIIALSQLNQDLKHRYNPKNPRSCRPILTDLRGSGGIKDAADMVAFLHRLSLYDENADPAEAIFRIAKDRLRGNLIDLQIHWESGIYT